MQDLSNENGKFVLKANYLVQYFQITAAIPSSLKQATLLTPISSEFLFSTPDLLYLSEKTTLSLSKMRCKHYYKLFNECSVSEPTGIKSKCSVSKLLKQTNKLIFFWIMFNIILFWEYCG